MTSQLTKHPGTDHFPIWSPDGADVAYTRFRDTDRESTKCGLMGRRPSESLSRRTLTLGLTLGCSIGDATLLWLRRNRNQPSILELWALPLSGDRKPFLYLPRFRMSGPAALSPNGRWLAYGTNDGGVEQVIVQSFPDPSKVVTRFPPRAGPIHVGVVADGSSSTSIRHRRLIAVSVSTDGPFKVQQTTELFTAPSPVVRCGAARGAFSVQRIFHGLSQPAPNQPCPELDDGTEVTWKRQPNSLYRGRRNQRTVYQENPAGTSGEFSV